MKRLYDISSPLIGITGGIATGKSTVSSIIKTQGEKVICADEIIKSIYTQKPTLSFIEKKCPSVIDKESKINFTKLRKEFFSNNKLKNEIENFLHPKIENEFKKKISKEDPYIFYDIPLLFEKDLHPYFDYIILVSSTFENQLSRIVERDKCGVDIAKKIISSQIPLNKKEANSDFIIQNNGKKDELTEKVLSTLQSIRDK